MGRRFRRFQGFFSGINSRLFTLVGAGEEDYDSGRILATSPIAQGLVGKKVGDRVEIEVPRGTLKFEIMQIRVDD